MWANRCVNTAATQRFFFAFCFWPLSRISHNNSFFSSPLFPSAAPPGINVLEHESIALDMPSSYSTFHPPNTYAHRSGPPPAVKPATPPDPKEEPFKPSFTPIVQPRELPRQRLPESFNLVTPLPSAFSLRTDCPVSLYRARMENRNVVLRVLKGRGRGGEKQSTSQSNANGSRFCHIAVPTFLPTDSADATERHNFLGFASFLSQLGPHPFLPELLGVVSLRAPLVTVVEEVENRDLLSLLWRCRDVNPIETATTKNNI